MKLTADQVRKYVGARLSQSLPYRDEVMLRCPFHRDGTASLSFNLAKGVWKCHAGCGEGGLLEFERRLNGGTPVEAGHRIEELLAVDHLFEAQRTGPAAVYRYTDAQGRLLFEKCRYFPKRFVQRRPIGEGKYEYKLEGIEKPLYRLPELLTANEIFVCEGEKDSDNVLAAFPVRESGTSRIAATTNFDGAGKWREQYAPYFLGKRVAILADNDEAGIRHAEQVARSLHRCAAGVKVIRFPGLAEHGDVSDWLAAGHTVAELLDMVRATPSWQPERTEHTLLVEAGKFASTAPPEVEWLVDGVIQKGANGIVTGEPKAGKSLLMMDLLLAIATGTPWLGVNIPRRAKVALVSREDYPGMTAQRMMALFRGSLRRTDFEQWMWVNTRWQTPTWSLQSDTDVTQLIAELRMENVEFCCLDVFRRLHAADENDNSEMQKVLDQLVRIQTEAGCALALVHHLSKDMNGSIFRRIRGASAIHGWTEWALAVTLARPEDERDLTRRIEFQTKAVEAARPMEFQIESTKDTMRLVPQPPREPMMADAAHYLK